MKMLITVLTRFKSCLDQNVLQLWIACICVEGNLYLTDARLFSFKIEISNRNQITSMLRLSSVEISICIGIWFRDFFVSWFKSNICAEIIVLIFGLDGLFVKFVLELRCFLSSFVFTICLPIFIVAKDVFVNFLGGLCCFGTYRIGWSLLRVFLQQWFFNFWIFFYRSFGVFKLISRFKKRVIQRVLNLNAIERISIMLISFYPLICSGVCGSFVLLGSCWFLGSLFEWVIVLVFLLRLLPKLCHILHKFNKVICNLNIRKFISKPDFRGYFFDFRILAQLVLANDIERPLSQTALLVHIPLGPILQGVS